MLLKEYLSIKKYQGSLLDNDVISDFKGFLKHRANTDITVLEWDKLFDRYIEDACIYQEYGDIPTYPILIYRNPEESRFEIIKEGETVSNFWRFLRRFKSFPDAITWVEHHGGDPFPSGKIPVALPKVEENIFDKRFVYLEWEDSLQSKKSVFVAKSYDALKEAVEHNLEYMPERSQKDPENLQYSNCPAHPFGIKRNTKWYTFAYYDPDYESKFALKCKAQEKKSKENLSIMGKIERLKAEPAMKSILIDLVNLINGKVDKG